MGIWTANGKFTFHGEPQDFVWGRSAFKMANWVMNGREDVALEFIEDTQRIFNRENVIFRVFLETAGWDPIPPEDGMFGSPPRDPGFWDVELLRRLSASGDRVRDLTTLAYKTLEWFFKTSQETGAAFELVIDATLKHTTGISADLIGHCIREVNLRARPYHFKYPKSLILISAHNEWDAHNHAGLTLPELNRQGMRMYRWKKKVGGDWIEELSFTSPGEGWNPEQLPEVPIIVDHGGRNSIQYTVGPGPNSFKAVMIHPERRSDWWKGPNSGELAELRRVSKGQPLGYTESMYAVDPIDRPRALRWYRGPDSWTTNLELYMQFIDVWPKQVVYGIVHDEKGAQTDKDWPRRETELEARLREYFRGSTVPGPGPSPPPPSQPGRPEFRELIKEMYREILKREADAPGLEHYNDLMKRGFTLAQVKEALLRSPEFKEKNF